MSAVLADSTLFGMLRGCKGIFPRGSVEYRLASRETNSFCLVNFSLNNSDQPEKRLDLVRRNPV